MRLIYFLRMISFFLVFDTWSRAELFSAVVSMIPLIDTLEKVINLIKQLTRTLILEETQVKTLQRHLKMFESEQEDALRDVPMYLANPINDYKIMKRLTIDLDLIENIIEKGIFKEIKETYIFPSSKDFKEACEALVRLHQVYRLNITELALGVLKSYRSSPMSSSDCYVLGVYFYKDKYNPIALISGAWWLLEALYNYEIDDSFLYNFTDADILGHLYNVYSIIGDESASVEWYGKIISPTHTRYKWIVKRHRERLYFKYLKELERLDRIANESKNETPGSQGDSFKFEFFCREGQEISPSKQKSLKCFYAHGPHASLLISPVKAEQLYKRPNIMLFHDAVSDMEIQDIINASIPLIQRSQIGVISKQNYRGKSVGRVSKDCVLLDKDDHLEAGLSKRASAVSGLDGSSAERLNVINYGIAGHFVPHLDAMKHVETKAITRGNRIATIVFYLSDVALGGSTVFTELGLTVSPEKGAALFFMNLEPSGNRDLLTMHGGCPVLHGVKWIANKWFYEKGQEFIRPCGLLPS